jgi:excisionase family DNA binding protein
MPKELDGHQFQTPDEVAREWGVSSVHVRRLCRSGKLQGHLIGTLWRIQVWAKEDFLRRTASRKAA